MESNQLIAYSLPKRHRRMRSIKVAPKCTPVKSTEITPKELPLEHIWNAGMAYSDAKDGWMIEPGHPMKNVQDICALAREIAQEKNFSLHRSRFETRQGKIWKQLYMFKQFGEKKLRPDYQDICRNLGVGEIYELSFYMHVTNAMRKEDKERVMKIIFYCAGETIVSTDDVLGIMLKPGANPQISILIKTEPSTRTIQSFLMKELGFKLKLANNYDGTCIRKHYINGKSDRI